MSRQSSRGNPYHYPKGHPKGGQFAPAGFGQAAASVCGQYFEDRSAFEAYEKSGQMDKDKQKYYNEERTKNRFMGGEATDGQKAFAAKIEKQLGVVAPVDGTARDYEDYIKENIHDYNSASEAQARTIRHLEEEHNITLASDDRYGGNAGSFIGHAKKAEVLLNKDNWEKGADGIYYCIERQRNEDGSLKLKKDGTPYGTNTGYRMVPVRVNGKTRYNVERGTCSYEEVDGKKVKVWRYHSIDGDKTGLKGLVKDDRSAAMKRASLNEIKRYAVANDRTATKRSPAGIKKTINAFTDMGDKSKWVEHNDGIEFSHTYNADNSYKYRIEQGTTGLHAYRMVTSVQTARVFDPGTGKMTTKRTVHTRKEWVATGCQSQEDAINECRKHEAASIKKRINLKAASDKEIDRWKKSGQIKSKNEYMHMLDPIKNFDGK